MIRRLLNAHIACALLLLDAGCATVPKQAVELAATVGRDLEVVHNSHRDLARLLFTRMKNDVNHFVDNRYAPALIASAMDKDYAASQSNDLAIKDSALLTGISEAFQPGSPTATRQAVLGAMGDFLGEIRSDVEMYRKELLDTLNDQEKEVIGSIDRAYAQLHYANSIVTGHLASVVKVQDVQAEALKAVGVHRDLREMVSTTLADTSGKLEKLVADADKIPSKLDEVQKKASSIKDTVLNLKLQLQPNKK